MEKKKQLVLATQNLGKIKEFERLLQSANLEIDVLGLKDFPDMPDVEETGSTFAENSLLKARAIAQFTGLPALADDSGLCVDALGGDPGIYSARWSGVHGDDQANTSKVLAQLRELDALSQSQSHSQLGRVDRSARFVCSVALVFPADHLQQGREIVHEADIAGEIIDQPIGTNGFGYDPIFRPTGYELTTAQMDSQTKDRISHRGQALAKILPQIKELI